MSKTLRSLLFALGLISLVLGVVGLFMPLLPTTPFILVAAWAFAKSSPRFAAWLEGHRHFGPMIRDWREHRAIHRRHKVFAVCMLIASAVMLQFTTLALLYKSLLWTFLSLVALFIMTRNERRPT